ncbi:alpha/beta fold hydrolase [Deinococcus gobiensis]|uniref:alpha/beta fold hydrolase n=1 Tax=Deinococcus gobiensis TaxID=502394 RepID=UPI0002D6DC79|nr:alpha/beta hydrolase [Deinococcus gobiensis]
MKKMLPVLSTLLVSTAFAGGAQPPMAPMPMPMPMPMPAAAPMAPGMADRGTVNVNGATVFYKAQGQGQPLLLIHGYPLSGELFKNNRVIPGYRVITVDLPGFGMSTAPSRDASIENYARTMVGFMDAMKIDKAVVGGMSMGGMTLLQMYKLAPERFKGLIFIDTTADPAGVAEAATWRGQAQQAEQMGVASLVPGLLPRMLTGESRMKMPNQVEHLSNIVKGASLNGAIGGGNALAARPDANPILPTIKVPTLLVFGAEDNVTPTELAMKMQKGIAGSKLALIPGAGHAAVFEKAAAANAAMVEWLRTVR